jgi:hypothetical protein
MLGRACWLVLGPEKTHSPLKNGFKLSQMALAWLKVHYYAEILVCSRTFDVEKNFSLSFPYMAICWLLVEFRIVEGGERELAEVSY